MSVLHNTKSDQIVSTHSESDDDEVDEKVDFTDIDVSCSKRWGAVDDVSWVEKEFESAAEQNTKDPIYWDRLMKKATELRIIQNHSIFEIAKMNKRLQVLNKPRNYLVDLIAIVYKDGCHFR
jgi:hypothetical protein